MVCFFGRAWFPSAQAAQNDCSRFVDEAVAQTGIPKTDLSFKTVASTYNAAYHAALKGRDEAYAKNPQSYSESIEKLRKFDVPTQSLLELMALESRQPSFDEVVSYRQDGGPMRMTVYKSHGRVHGIVSQPSGSGKGTASILLLNSDCNVLEYETYAPGAKNWTGFPNLRVNRDTCAMLPKLQALAGDGKGTFPMAQAMRLFNGAPFYGARVDDAQVYLGQAKDPTSTLSRRKRNGRFSPTLSESLIAIEENMPLINLSTSREFGVDFWADQTERDQETNELRILPH
jgi:hypothetical protein